MNNIDTTKTVDDARQGETSNHMRWVLIFTIVFSVIAVGVIALVVV